MTTRTQSRWSSIAAALPLLIAMPLVADDDHRADDRRDRHEEVNANLSGYQEVPTLSSGGSARFFARIADDNQSFDWVLTFSGLVAVTQSHIHFAARALNGPIVIFLCTNLGNATPGTTSGTQACPTTAGTVRGTAVPSDVGAGAVPMGIPAGDFAKVLDALRNKAAYANIHTAARPGGEIRGQIHDGDHHHH